MNIFSKIKSTDNLLIAAVPILGYITAFFYQAGKFSVLKVPEDYIQISLELILLSSILTASLLLISAILYLGRGIFTINKSIKKQKYYLNGSPVTKTSFLESIIITFLLPIGIALIIYTQTTLTLFYISIISSGIFILFIGLFFIPPLIKYPNEKSYIYKFDLYQEDKYKSQIKLARSKMNKKNEEPSLSSKINKHSYSIYIKLCIFLIIWSIFAFLLGISSMKGVTYSVVKINKNSYIILGTYLNKYILVGINKDKKTTTSEILLINNEQDLKIFRENIGIINETKYSR